MKKIVLIMLISFAALSGAEAQNFREWFRQKKTKREYMLRQLALLKVYITQVKKGVTVVRRGLNTVQNVKNGEFNLHKDFFSYLKNVNPVIAKSAKVADIIAFQVFIIKQLSETNQYCRKHGKFTPQEVRYVADVYANMLVLCDANLGELFSIIKPDKTKMTDDERLSRIDVLHADMKDKQRFVQAFDLDVRYIGANRQQEFNDVQILNSLYFE